VTHEAAVETLAAERYLLDEMSGADREAFEDHFFSCETCAADLRSCAAMLRGANAGFAGTGSHARVAVATNTAVERSAWYRSAVLPWAAAAALAAVTTSQSFWIASSLRRDASPVAIAPVTLRPAARGADAIVPLPRGTDPVSLAVEMNGRADGSKIAYTLSTSDGRHIVSGLVAAPAPGTPLLLLIPSAILVGPMHYILSVHDTGPSQHSFGEYRFTLSPE
jgi:hypothetical protein